MGGTGSGRVSIKKEAVMCILDVQMQLQGLKYDGIHGNMTIAEIGKLIDEAIQTCKVKQEQIERLS